MRGWVLGALVLGVVLATAVGGAAATTLDGSVGPGFTISGPTGTLPPGDYALVVSDQSSAHNFHLTGPGVNDSTGVAA
ncbi:MAG TPA: hypothetical protein VJ689_05465, partial [Gaiellaceae bacterium]|nr:hypothetical protein [Gaiellaceae bacterium]